MMTVIMTAMVKVWLSVDDGDDMVWAPNTKVKVKIRRAHFVSHFLILLSFVSQSQSSVCILYI